MLKRRGTRTDPCGTPFLRRRNLCLLKITHRFQTIAWDEPGNVCRQCRWVAGEVIMCPRGFAVAGKFRLNRNSCTWNQRCNKNQLTKKTDRTIVTKKSRNQLKRIVDQLPWQQKVQDCYQRTITSSHPNKIAEKYQQKACDHYIMDNHDQEVHVTRSTCDRRSIWQEMRQRNTTWSSEEQEPGANNLKKVPEAKKKTNHKRSWQERTNQTPKTRGADKSSERAFKEKHNSAIIAAEYGPKTQT